MAKERRILLEPKDVLGIRVRCKDCGIEVTYTFDRQQALTDRCQFCGASSRGIWETTDELRRILGKLANQDDHEMSVRLELDAAVGSGTDAAGVTS